MSSLLYIIMVGFDMDRKTASDSKKLVCVKHFFGMGKTLHKNRSKIIDIDSVIAKAVMVNDRSSAH